MCPPRTAIPCGVVLTVMKFWFTPVPSRFARPIVWSVLLDQ